MKKLIRLLACVGFGVLVVAVCCLGAAWGAEGDVIAYLVAHKFRLNVYSTVLSILSAVIGVSSALGALILSRMLAESDSFNGFLLVAGSAALIGGTLFLLVGPHRKPTDMALQKSTEMSR